MSISDNPQFEPQPQRGSERPDQPENPSAAGTLGGPSETGVARETPTLSVPPLSPARDPVWSGWDVMVIAGFTFLSILVLGFSLVVGMHLLYPRTNLNSEAPIIAITAQFLAYVAGVVCTVMLVEGKYQVRFWQAIRWNWPRSQWKMFGGGVLLLLSINVLARFLPMPKSTPFDQFFERPRDAYLIAGFAVTLGPFMEELFFRGLLYPVLARRLGVFWGIVLTALPFGLMHMFQYGYAWGVVLLIFVMGVVCTVVRAVTKSVASSFLVHVGYNATEMFLLILATAGFRHMERAACLL